MTNEEKIEILAEAMDIDSNDLHENDNLKKNDVLCRKYPVLQFD